ncbi:hypothetical protein ICN84_01250 [Akkermansia glycaniphila]|uniref:hypothetical protein n=1 Tax=Akkermansia glycaniphila TaxID=1679444 RepID=UPI001C0340E6|nr:hypothetical protein [Akkermansia glycaniphila]MBT9448696.1 hypothetical protein [Akkermansia glycaniphila]
MRPLIRYQTLLTATLVLSITSCQLIPWTEWQHEPPLSTTPGLAPCDISGHQIRFTPAEPHGKIETYNFLHGSSIQKSYPTFSYANLLEPWMEQNVTQTYQKTGANTAIVDTTDSVNSWSTCVQRGGSTYTLTFLTPHSGIASCLDLPSPDLSRKSYTFNIKPVARPLKRIGIRGGFVPDKAAPQP